MSEHRELSIVQGAGGLYLAVAVAGGWVSVREDLPGRPLGLATPLGVRTDLLVGFGSALSAPWPLLAATGATLGRLRRTGGASRGPVALLVGLGAAFLVGMVAEPVTGEVIAAPRAHPRRTAFVAANLVLPTTFGIAALRSLARPVDRSPGCSADTSDRDRREGPA